jgi:ATP-dependent exoDNAse (exonuclease V) alpha subunit
MRHHLQVSFGIFAKCALMRYCTLMPNGVTIRIMAIYHLSHGIVSRSTGRSSVQSAAYITGEKLHESRRDLKVNYQNRHRDIAFTSTLAPEHAPAKFHELGVWDLLETFEDAYGNKRYQTDETRAAYLNSAQTAQTIVVALPKELAVDVCKELITQFAKERFVSRGLIVTTAIHDDEGNPHAHLQISRRSVNENGELSWTKDREICTKKELLVTRKLWADLTNQYLEREGYEARITEKSFADLGIQLEPTQHRGWVSDKLESMGITSRIVTQNAEIYERNREELIESPAALLPELTQNNATFTQMNLLKGIQKRVGDDAPLVAQVFEKALQESIVVGEGIDGQIRYTSPAYKALEDQAVGLVADLSRIPFEQPHLAKETTLTYLATHFAYLSQEQKEAVIGLTQDNSLSVLVGRAGAGKTTTLKAVSDIYKEAGHRVIGTSLSAMAADNLGKEAHINSATLHSWIYQWERYLAAQDKFLSFDSVMEEGVFKQLDWYQDLKRFEGSVLTKDTVLIVDEAGMLGTRLWNELLVHVSRSGAKLIVVGDDNQFKAIEAGDFFREIKHQAKDQDFSSRSFFELNTIYRQQQDWMKDASQNLANLEIGEALSAYEQRGCIHQTNKENLANDIAAAYVNSFQNEQTSLVLAFTNAQTIEINQTIRKALKREGLIDQKDIVDINGRSFAIGDKVVFLENDKTRLVITDRDGVVKEGGHIKNGTQGKIKGVNQQGDLQVQLNDNLFTTIACIQTSTSKVAIGQPEPDSIRTYVYTNIAHGYAVTCHKAQGQTIDNVFVAASKNMDAKGVYVAMTRHRHDVQLFYAKEDFSTFKALSSHLSRFEHKDLVKDYTIRPENEAAWQRVQEYRLCVLDGAAVLKEQSKNNQNEGQVDWEAYRQIKQDQITLGREILDNFESHKLYINQAGLTNEMLQITTGLKARPLSNAEEKAKLTVELYGETAQVARDLWREIRKTHPGNQCYHHLNYGQFTEMRNERNSLAYTIGESYSLHREFVNEFSRVYGINKRTVEAQRNQFIEQQRERIQQQGFKSTGHNIIEKQDKLWYNNKLDNLSYGKYITNKITNNVECSQSQRIENKIQYKHKSLDPALIKQELNAHIKDLAYQFLGQPQQQKATEWRYGNKGSINIHVAGHRQGLYSNFETGESGNAIKFIQDQLKCDHKQAFKWGVEWLGHDRERQLTQQPAAQFKENVTIKTLMQTKQEWTPIFPAPTTPVDLKIEKAIRYMLKGRQEMARYTYKDADNNVLGYVVRLEDKHGNKITPTLTYCQNEKGEQQWRWQGFGNDRPLYGLNQLKAKPNAPVLIVEGEKTCEAAREIFKDHAVITWSGGCGAVQKSDWSVLKDRNVTIWPDHDQPGLNAASKIAGILNEQGNQAVKIVDVPSTLPHKWDLADRIPDGLDVRDILTSNSKEPAKEEVVKDLPVSLPHTDKINQIIQLHKLDTTFGDLNNADYHHVHKVFDVLKEAYQLAKIKTEDDWTLKRATFMVYNLREFSSLPMTDEERARTCLVAATIFANQNERTDATTTYQAHFKAVGVINTHNQSKDSYMQAENSFKELFGFQPNASLEVRQHYVSALQEKLFAQIKQLDLHYQQRNLEIASKALDMQKGKDLEL